MSEKPVIHKGLEGIYVKETLISYIDGFNGKLYYRGYSIEDLAKYSNYEEVAFLLIYGWLPKPRDYNKWVEDLKKERSIPEELIEILKKTPKWNAPLDVFKCAVVHLGLWDPDANNLTWDSLYNKVVKILAKAPTVLAAWHRIREGKEPVKPDPQLNHAANFLYMMHGERPSEEIADAFDKILVLHAEHGMNASAFAGMLTISTLSDIYSAIGSAINTLKGPLHGGAAGATLAMLKEIGSPENVEKYVEEKLARKERIMGFGHRVYKTYDPRAKIIRELAIKLAKEGEAKKLLEIALKVEEVCLERLCKTKKICPNVDFFTGTVYKALGFPEDFAPAVFAMSRLAGWLAHILEYVKDNRLIRPRAYYVGEMDKPYIPMDMRS